MILEADINRVSSKASDWGLKVEDKWKIVSHLHKAIRHGRPDDAEQGVRWLLELDPTYLRYRMAVIAVEDVAAGSPEVVARSMEHGWNKMSLYSLGPEYLVEQARLWAEATKDRTPCTWMDCAFYGNQFQDMKGSWDMLPPKTAARMVFDESQPWWFRGLAAWRAAGSSVFKSSHLNPVQGDWDYFIEKAVENVSLTPAQLACIQAGQKFQAEAHPIFLPLAFQEQNRGPIKTIEREIPQLGYCGPFLSSALDKHTSEGRKAVQGLLKGHHHSKKVLMGSSQLSLANAEKAIGYLWFWMEGGLLDKRLAYPLAEEMEREAKKSRLKQLDVLPRELFESYGLKLQSWQNARKDTIRNQYSPSIVMPVKSFKP